MVTLNVAKVVDGFLNIPIIIKIQRHTYTITTVATDTKGNQPLASVRINVFEK